MMKTEGNIGGGGGGSNNRSSSNNNSSVVVVFDFDKTIIDVDSDNWVVDALGFTDLFNRLLPTMPWNTLMDTMMLEMHEQGVTIQGIAEALYTVPIHPSVISAIKSAHAAGCDLRIVSDANRFFIETILSHLGLMGYFSEINTNPGFVDDKGRLRILPHHDFTTSPHGCKGGVCPPNMCKGLVVERMLTQIRNDDVDVDEHEDEEGKIRRLIYLGDGTGDYCPTLKLRSRDVVMPRKGYPLWELIAADPNLVAAEIHEWSDGQDLQKTLLCLVDAALVSSPFSSPSSSTVADTTSSEEEDEDDDDDDELAAESDLLAEATDRCNFGRIPTTTIQHEAAPLLPVPY